MERTDVRIDSRVAKDLRKYVFEKYGYLHGKIKEEVESAIKAYIVGNPIVIAPVQNAKTKIDESSFENMVCIEKKYNSYASSACQDKDRRSHAPDNMGE